MILKFESSNNEKSLLENLELSKLENQALISTIKELSEKTDEEKKIIDKRSEDRVKEISNIMRSKIKTHEENILIIKDQYKQIQGIYTERIKQLEYKISKVYNENNDLKHIINSENKNLQKELLSLKEKVFTIYESFEKDKSNEDNAKESQSKENFPRQGKEKNKSKVLNKNVIQLLKDLTRKLESRIAKKVKREQIEV